MTWSHSNLKRWSNEGFYVCNGKKRLTYDELSLSQWDAGQLTNIYAISDPVQVKQAVFRMSLAMRDAVRGLPVLPQYIS